MQQYLLRRRLRHLRSIAVQNISLHNIAENFLNEKHELSFCFIVQSLENEVIYVSELISGEVVKLQINELRFDKVFGLLDQFVINLAIQIPAQLLKDGNEDVWTIIKSFTVDLRKLHYLGSHPRNYTFSGTAVLLLELQDGWYTTQGTIYRIVEPYTVPKIKLDTNNCKQSCSFNSLLKISKLIQYVSDVDEERLTWASKIDSMIQPELDSQKFVISDIKSKLDEVINKCEKKKKEILKLNEKVTSLLADKDSFETTRDTSTLDDYGTVYAALSNTNESLEKLQRIKIRQLIKIFENTILLDEKYGFVALQTDSELDNPTTKLVLETIERNYILNLVSESQEKKDAMNAYLGYYSLFILIYSRHIINRPLPYDITFNGNRTVIDKKYTLCCPDSHSLRVRDEVVTAIDLFNKNIIQVIHYIRHINEFKSL